MRPAATALVGAAMVAGCTAASTTVSGVSFPDPSSSTLARPTQAAPTVVQSPGASPTAPTGRPGYVALGDSVTFGYRERNSTPAPDYSDAADAVGYPEIVGAARHLDVANFACPGETSAGLIDGRAPSVGCESSLGGLGPGYRSAYPLHVAYSGSQLPAAVAYLHSHPGVRLVTLMIGANDAFLCRETTSDDCASEVPRLLARLTTNVRTVVRAIRGVYRGRLVLVNYYGIDYGTTQTGLTSPTIDRAMDAGAAGSDARIADGYAAFRTAARADGGDSCRAGLLTHLGKGRCGIHPSAAGQRVLAKVVEQAMG